MCYTIDEIKEKTIPIAIKYDVDALGLFGSYARGEATEESDVDLLVKKGGLRSLIQYFAFVNELEKALRCHVDLVTSEIEDRAFLDNAYKDQVILYERKR